MRFAFAGTLGTHHGGALDSGIVRTLWMTPEEIRACPERHRSPLVLHLPGGLPGTASFPLGLVHTDASVTTPQDD